MNISIDRYFDDIAKRGELTDLTVRFVFDVVVLSRKTGAGVLKNPMLAVSSLTVT